MTGRPFKKAKLKKRFTSLKELLQTRTYVDAGEIEIVASLKDIPMEGSRHDPYQTAESKFGTLPWRLLISQVDAPRAERRVANPPVSVKYLKVSLQCTHKEPERHWTAKAAGILRLEKWPEKLKGKPEEEKKSNEHKEHFARKFNFNDRTHKFYHLFPIPTRSSALGLAPLADSLYMKNGMFRLRLEIAIHNVRKVHFPFYDFEKSTPHSNALVKVVDKHKQIHRFHVNKEYLAMHSEALETMFNNPNFIEGRTNEVEFPNVEHHVFLEFLHIIYPGRRRPQVKFLRELLEFARMYFIPTVTAICEQRLMATEDKEMSVGERLKLADQYGLFQVKSKIMQLMDMEKLDLSKLEGLSPETLQMLLRKVNMEKQYKRNKKSGDKQGSNAMEVDQPSTSASGRRHTSGRSGGGHGSGYRRERRR